MKRNVLLVLCFSMSLFAVGDELMQKDYQNDHRMPLVIDVPYYEEGKDSYEIYEQTLQPGDYYQSGKGENGYVFKQYGLMPELASNVMSMENKKVIKNYLFYTEKREKEYCNLDNQLNTILVTNCVLVSPKIMAVKRIHDQIVSNEFYIENLTNTNAFYTLVRSYYGPTIISYDTSLIFSNYFYYFSLNPNQKAKFYMLFDFKKFPTFVPPWADVEVRVKYYDSGKVIFSDQTDVINIMPLFINDNYRPPKPPEIISPTNGQRLTTLKDVKFKFRSNITNKKRYISRPEGDGNHIDLSCYLYRIGPDGKSKWLNTGGSLRLNLVAPYIYTIDDEIAALNKWGKIKKDDEFFFVNNIDPCPGNYIWRITKESYDDQKVSSDWRWLSVGEEISKETNKPPEGESEVNNIGVYSKKNNFNCCINEFTQGVALHENNINSINLSNAYFAFPLPKGVKLENKKRHGYYGDYLTGVPEELGRFTNYWIGVDINRHGNISTQEYIFIVRNDRNKIKNNSFYHLNKRAIVHDLTVNIAAKFKIKDFYDEFYKERGLEFDETAEIKFSDQLPSGLTEERTSDGDLIISGVPKFGGVFTNVFIISSNGISVEQKHIFRIQDIGEPIPQKKITRRTKTEWYDLHGMIFHFCFIGEDACYPMANDIFWYKPKEYTKELQYELLGELPKGFKIAMHEPEPRFDHYNLPQIISICGIPEEAGTFTNAIKYIVNGKEMIRKHVFKINKTPQRYEEFDVD